MSCADIKIYRVAGCFGVSGTVCVVPGHRVCYGTNRYLESGKSIEKAALILLLDILLSE